MCPSRTTTAPTGTSRSENAIFAKAIASRRNVSSSAENGTGGGYPRAASSPPGGRNWLKREAVFSSLRRSCAHSSTG